GEFESRMMQFLQEQLAGLPDWPTTREETRWKLLHLIYQALEEVPDDAPAFRHLKAVAEAAWEYEEAEDKERAYFETYREGIREALHAANTAKEVTYGEYYPGPDEYYQEYDEPLDEDYDDHE
ncbi:MAG TPA: hypothetical protein VFL91_00925, partial [Thermomicrobiales bacterium]|nr:hypothetical protein [Thermomicrobiales bacterium]